MDNSTQHFTQKAKEYRELLKSLKKGRMTVDKKLQIEKVELDLKFARWVLKRNKKIKDSIKEAEK